MGIEKGTIDSSLSHTPSWASSFTTLSVQTSARLDTSNDVDGSDFVEVIHAKRRHRHLPSLSKRVTPEFDIMKLLERVNNSSFTSSPADLPLEVERPFVSTTFIPRSNSRISLSSDWEMLLALQPETRNWTYQHPMVLREREKRRHVRAFLPDQSPNTPQLNLSTSFTRYMMLHTKSVDETLEMTDRNVVGRVIADVISTRSIPAQRFS
jgi:hypothetical protein